LTSAAAQQHYQEMTDRFLHPWLQHSRRRAPGSHMLLYGLIVATSTAYHSPFARWDDPPRISPFMSQPLVELVLRTPTHLHFESGMDRALARSAYSDVLPSSILQRGLGKGGPNLWARDVVESNTAFLREFLLDGILVQRNLINRAKVESALSATIVKSTSIVGDIFAKLYIESWLRKAQDLLCPSLSRLRA
jgi:asparagine synthase (glutamine-hydrolysing)